MRLADHIGLLAIIGWQQKRGESSHLHLLGILLELSIGLSLLHSVFCQVVNNDTNY